MHKHRLGLVSLYAPLISNLNIWNNIALIPQYHQNISQVEARDLVNDLLCRAGMESISEKRNSSLTTEERFCAMLLRALMVRDAVVVLDRPFSILTDLRDGNFIMDTLQKFDDLIVEVHIFDYSWAESYYGGIDGIQN